MMIPACGVRECLSSYLSSIAGSVIDRGLRIVMIGSKDASDSLRVVHRCRREEPSVVGIVSGTGKRCNSYIGTKLRVTAKGCFEVLSTSS